MKSGHDRVHGAVRLMAAVVSLNMTNAVLAQPTQLQGLVSWWSGDGTTLDSAGTNDGEAHGSLAYAPGIVGQGFALNGSNSYVLIPSSTSLDPGTGSFTLEAWFNALTPLFDEGANIFGRYSYGGLGSGGRSDFGISGGTNGVAFGIRDSAGGLGDDEQTITVTASLDDGQFHHVAAGRDQTSHTLFLYLDGVAHTAPLTAVGSIYGDGETAPRLIGTSDFCCGQSIGTFYGQSVWFSGRIDEVKYYNRALTAQEIATIYHYKRGWPFLSIALSGGPVISLVGPTNRDYRIEYSDNLQASNNWVVLDMVRPTTAPWFYTNTPTATQSRRFYRVVLLPPDQEGGQAVDRFHQ